MYHSMIDTLSLMFPKRNQPKSLSKKDSRLNVALKKLTESLYSKNEKKNVRKCSLFMIFQLFRSSDDSFANDAMFEIKNYQQQKKMKDSLSLYSIYSYNDNKVMPQKRTLSNDSIHQDYAYPKSFKKSYTDPDPRAMWRLSSNLTVHSENLTAKEFADMTGIKILPEDEEEKVLIAPQESYISSSHSLQISDYIWNSSFWKNPKNNDQLTLQPYRIEPPPILRELKHHKTDLSQDTFIKRGRFEIHLYANSHPIIQPPQKHDTVIEWKRKSRPVSLVNAPPEQLL